MDIGYEVLINSPADACKVVLKDVSECFICRDGEMPSQGPLYHYCDCKCLVAHHHCLITWIKKYQLQNHPPWRSVARQWQGWLVLTIAVALLGLVPYAVVRMMTAFENPPPHTLFKVASVCFGLLTETLLLKCLASYCSTRYREAQQFSFSVVPRRAKGQEGGSRPSVGRREGGPRLSDGVAAAPGSDRKQ